MAGSIPIVIHPATSDKQQHQQPYFPPPPHKSQDVTNINNVGVNDALTPQDLYAYPLWRRVDSVRSALTLLILAAAIVILGTAAHALWVYNKTHVPADLLLPLWPADFNAGPTRALVGCSVVVIVTSVVSLVAARYLRARPAVYTPAALGAPLLGFVAALVAMSFFYGVNSSSSVDTLQSWSCRWRAVSMDQMPHFGTLCSQSRTAVALSAVLVALELVLTALVGYQVFVVEKAATRERMARKLGGTPESA